MSNLYLIDRPLAQQGMAFAAADDEAVVVLIQDGVYADVSALAAAGRPLYAVQKDIVRRGLDGRLADSVHTIGYDELVDLIVENKVVNFA